jgi:hypothetical protein
VTVEIKAIGAMTAGRLAWRERCNKNTLIQFFLSFSVLLIVKILFYREDFLCFSFVFPFVAGACTEL